MIPSLTRQDTVHRDLGPLAAARQAVDRLFDEIPANRNEARRLVTRAWGFEPTSAELQAILRLSQAPAGRGPLSELARAALSARIATEQELRTLLDSPELEERRYEDSLRRHPVLARAVSALTRRLREVATPEERAERELRQSAEMILAPCEDALAAIAVLAPRLARLAQATEREHVLGVLPYLTEDELQTVAAFVCPDPGRSFAPGRNDEARRLALDALVLSAVIREDVESWKAHGADAALERLRLDRTVYRVVSGRLERRQDTALLAGLKRYVGELRAWRQQLFSTYQLIATELSATRRGALREAGIEDEVGGEAAGSIPDESSDLVAESTTVEPVPQREPEREATKPRSWQRLGTERDRRAPGPTDGRRADAAPKPEPERAGPAARRPVAPPAGAKVGQRPPGGDARRKRRISMLVALIAAAVAIEIWIAWPSESPEPAPGAPPASARPEIAEP